MSKFLVFEVTPRGERWELRDPTGTSLMHGASKKDLLWNAARVAREHAPSQILVRGPDGQLLDEFTYSAAPVPPLR